MSPSQREIRERIMAEIKCKMCGDDLIIKPGSTVAECEFCGIKQTVNQAFAAVKGADSQNVGHLFLE